eukprot:jgi/Picre1/33198/NNA_008523.t1
MCHQRWQFPRGQDLSGGSHPQASLKVGDKAPAFSLKNQNGKTVKVEYGGLIGAKPTVVFFYPKIILQDALVRPRRLKMPMPRSEKLPKYMAFQVMIQKAIPTSVLIRSVIHTPFR